MKQLCESKGDCFITSLAFLASQSTDMNLQNRLHVRSGWILNTQCKSAASHIEWWAILFPNTEKMSKTSQLCSNRALTENKFILIIVSGVSRRHDTEQTKKSKLLVKTVTDLNTIQWKEHWKGGREECDRPEQAEKEKKYFKTLSCPNTTELHKIINNTEQCTVIFLVFSLCPCFMRTTIHLFIITENSHNTFTKMNKLASVYKSDMASVRKSSTAVNILKLWQRKSTGFWLVSVMIRAVCQEQRKVVVIFTQAASLIIRSPSFTALFC